MNGCRFYLLALKFQSNFELLCSRRCRFYLLAYNFFQQDVIAMEMKIQISSAIIKVFFQYIPYFKVHILIWSRWFHFLLTLHYFMSRPPALDVLQGNPISTLPPSWYIPRNSHTLNLYLFMRVEKHILEFIFFFVCSGNDYQQ